ncbi:MAG TPA: ImmA/IrrE family metallo-endopeptidase [Longimicrobiales bacterium]|nr:ImmA/IrrE family metallo-endopeptidase [Longimicrobiales bacterium]
MTEHGYAVRPRSTVAIAHAAERFLARCAPEHLTSGRALDLAYLVDYGLEREGITVVPVQADDLPSAEAETRATDGRWLEIWIREEFYTALFERNSSSNRARSTLAHEIGHAVLHAEDVRMGRHRPDILALRRAPRSKLKPYQDSEWQAHVFAGALLLPRPVLRGIALADTNALADRFEVSESFVQSHLRRIRQHL